MSDLQPRIETQQDQMPPDMLAQSGIDTQKLALAEEVRDWILYVVESVLEEYGNRKEPALKEVRSYWASLNEDKAAAFVDVYGLRGLPNILLKVIAEDARMLVQRALREDVNGLLERDVSWSEQVAAYAKQTGFATDREVRERGRALSVKILKDAKEGIQAGRREPLRGEEVVTVAEMAKHIPMPELIREVIYFASQSPEVADALLNNPLLAEEGRANTAEGRAFINEVLGGVVIALRVNPEQLFRWKFFLHKAFKLSLAHGELQSLRAQIIQTARLHALAADMFIGDRLIPDTVIQVLLPLELLRQVVQDPGWFHILRDFYQDRRRLCDTTEIGKILRQNPKIAARH